MRSALILTAALFAAACNPATDETATPDTTFEAPADPAGVNAPPTIVVITEQDARSRIEAAGYTDVTGLTQNTNGAWTATAMRDGQSTTVTVGEGGVSVVTTP